MTFLELCQAMAREAGISGGVVSVTDQVGEARRVVGWVTRAYKYIQNRHSDWKFLRLDAEFPAVSGQARYKPEEAGITISEFGNWCFRDEWRCYRTEAGYPDEQPVSHVNYEAFRRTYGYGNQRLQTGRPQVVTVTPDRTLILWPTPDAEYTVVGEKYRAPHILVENDDVPIFAARFHDAITYRALMYYGEFEGDAAVIATAQSETDRELAALEDYYLPRMNACSSKALA